MSLPKTYNPNQFENRIYALWEERGAFSQSHNPSQKTFTVVLPPPNANADLHCGHALDFQLKDILGRWRRLHGDFVLLLPGADHAGFETWVVYEKHLNAQGKSRFDYPRDELYRQVYDFVINNKINMEQQIRRLGISCDWQRFTFSLDERIVKTTYDIFHKMWQDGLIYRDKKLINYCTEHGTGFSDFEVTHQVVAGHLWFIKYPLKNDSQTITIATTRPETMLGDTAVAVHPQDDRYRHLIGQSVVLPFSQREIPIIADERVQKDFGSGAVKITPAHDFLDFEIAADHQLPNIEVIDKTGVLSDNAPPQFRGLKTLEARQKVVEQLKQEGWLEKTVDYEHQVGHCYKCHNILEPLLADQWFVNMKPLAAPVIKELQAGRPIFYPDAKRRELILYLEQLEDWNISRQIAWGIPIPVFENVDQPGDWIFHANVEETIITSNGKTYRRDPDVFDTWWSSGQWAYATFDRHKEPHLYPQTLMETGADILRPWVSRMLMLGFYATGSLPFDNVYLHGMVVDEYGAKMSKSKGNVVNPMEIIEEYGADALRLGICSQVAAGNPQKFLKSKMKMGRNFCNKLFNIGRFLQAKCNHVDGRLVGDGAQLQTMPDHWVWQQFLQAKEKMDQQLTRYRLAQAIEIGLNFVWDDLADWYLEASKQEFNQSLAVYLFEQTLKLTHPLAPFVTEALFQELLATPKKPLLINNLWEQDLNDRFIVDADQVQQFNKLQTLINQVRQAAPLDVRRKSGLRLKNPKLLQPAFANLLSHFTDIPQIDLLEHQDVSTDLLISQMEDYEAWLIVDRQQLQKTLNSLRQNLNQRQKVIDILSQRLSNQGYLDKAPKKLQAESRTQLEKARAELQELRAEQEKLQTLL